MRIMKLLNKTWVWPILFTGTWLVSSGVSLLLGYPVWWEVLINFYMYWIAFYLGNKIWKEERS